MALASGSGISCPNGGLFYVCQGNSTQFLGCCNSDPCSDGSGICPDSNLRNTSYSASLYDSIPTQACVDEGDWYTCAYTSPPFMGCCVTNPCATGGCYGDNVTAARLSDNGNNAAAFETTQASTPTSTSTSSPSASSSSLAGDDHTHVSSLSTGAIVGIAIGSAIAALIVGILLFCLYKRHERNKKHVLAGQGQAAPHGTPGMGNASPYQGKIESLSTVACFSMRFCVRRAADNWSQTRPGSQAHSFNILVACRNTKQPPTWQAACQTRQHTTRSNDRLPKRCRGSPGSRASKAAHLTITRR